MATTRKVGRPRIAKSRSIETVAFRLTTAERKAAERKASQQGHTLSQWFRWLMQREIGA